MKLLIPIFFVFSSLYANNLDDEIEVLQDLVAATQKSLNIQKDLLLCLVTFKQARAAFVEEPTSRKLASALVKAAKEVQKNLDNGHLSHLFSGEFLEELQFFNQLGTKTTP